MTESAAGDHMIESMRYDHVSEGCYDRLLRECDAVVRIPKGT
jgi:hypothetical protein